MNKLTLIPLAFVCIATMPTFAQQKKNQTASTQVASLQRQVKTLKEERDALQTKVDEFPMLLRQENADLYRQLDEANAEKERAFEEMDVMRDTLRENQSGGDSLLRELQQTKNALRNRDDKIEELEREIALLQVSLDNATNKEGSLVHLGPGINPAKCINLRRMTPKVKRASGIVVINCLIDEMGEPVDVRLIQPLPGEETEWNTKAHEACLEAAKKLAFEPATTSDGRRVKVWQGVAFNLN